MSPQEQAWCAQTICDAIEADSATTDYLSIVARNPMEGSRPAAFAVSALFDKSLPPAIQERILPMLAKAVIHPVEETVAFAVQGIARFLWRSDRPLALTCVQALVNQAVEEHAFLERRRRRPLLENITDESYDAYKASLRTPLREFVGSRGNADKAQIVGLDLARWPGLRVSKHLFAIATQQPDDPLARDLMRRCISTLPVIWEANERNRHLGSRGRSDEDRFDAGYEQELVEATCRFVLHLDPGEALEMLEPVFAAARQFPEQASGIVNWLILAQGDRIPASPLWTLWQRF
jgi:hypothetical protein